MFVKSTIIKVLILVIIIAIGFLVYKNNFFPPSSVKPSTKNVSITPTSQISLAPTDKKTGWTVDEENQILNQCPLPSFASAICKCALTKVEQQYSFDEAMKLYNSYQQTKSLDPKLTAILNECK